jgi:AcrR family transcriptional regulator
MQQPEHTARISPEAQRSNILAAARRVFARKGKAATMADIAQAAGVSQGLPYRYFPGKDAIFRELVEQALTQAQIDSTAPAEAASPTPGERLATLITQMVEYRRDNLEFFQLLDQVVNSGQPPDDITDMIRRRRTAFLAELRALIVAAQASGECAADDPDQLVFAVTACLDGLTRFGLHQPERFATLCPGPEIILRLLRP